MKQIFDIVNRIIVMSLALVLIYVLGRVFIIDSFVVRGPSMEPTINDGQRVFVNKLAMGARIYTRFAFDTPDLQCVRMPGYKKLQPDDIAVFNYPFGWEKGKIGFRINYVYAKRCIGTPGDYVEIHKGHFSNSRFPSRPLGNDKMQALLAGTSDSTLVGQGVRLKAFGSKYTNWTIKEFGPILIPQRGLTIDVDTLSLPLYSKVIEYETKQKATKGRYTFKEDYYFFVGDNVLDSRDSRYFGFVPERYIIGKLFIK